MINHIEISQPDIAQTDTNCFSLHNSIKTVILNHSQYMENKLTESIIQAAKEAGVNELYLIDKDEVKSAIEEYFKRKKMITSEDPIILKNSVFPYALIRIIQWESVSSWRINSKTQLHRISLCRLFLMNTQD